MSPDCDSEPGWEKCCDQDIMIETTSSYWIFSEPLGSGADYKDILLAHEAQ